MQHRSSSKNQNENLVWLALAAMLLWLLFMRPGAFGFNIPRSRGGDEFEDNQSPPSSSSSNTPFFAGPAADDNGREDFDPELGATHPFFGSAARTPAGTGTGFPVTLAPAVTTQPVFPPPVAPDPVTLAPPVPSRPRVHDLPAFGVGIPIRAPAVVTSPAIVPITAPQPTGRGASLSELTPYGTRDVRGVDLDAQARDVHRAGLLTAGIVGGALVAPIIVGAAGPAVAAGAAAAATRAPTIFQSAAPATAARAPAIVNQLTGASGEFLGLLPKAGPVIGPAIATLTVGVLAGDAKTSGQTSSERRRENVEAVAGPPLTGRELVDKLVQGLPLPLRGIVNVALPSTPAPQPPAPSAELARQIERAKQGISTGF